MPRNANRRASIDDTIAFVSEADAGVPIELPSGKTWLLEDVLRKLSLRAGLPGARVYDLSASALRTAKEKGVPLADRFALALPGSWLVNSPASSVVMRRWALSPAREPWLRMLEALDADQSTFDTGAWKEAVRRSWPALGDEAFLIEAVSKLIALLAPDRVPLMPAPARAFVLGEHDARTGADAFIDMVEFFVKACRDNAEDLQLVAEHHAEVPLSGPQALDRLLWFDSEGHRHWPAPK